MGCLGEEGGGGAVLCLREGRPGKGSGGRIPGSGGRCVPALEFQMRKQVLEAESTSHQGWSLNQINPVLNINKVTQVSAQERAPHSDCLPPALSPTVLGPQGLLTRLPPRCRASTQGPTDPRLLHAVHPRVPQRGDGAGPRVQRGQALLRPLHPREDAAEVARAPGRRHRAGHERLGEWVGVPWVGAGAAVLEPAQPC